MTVLEALLLGVVQGLTEFLPVSSSGHLAVLKHLFGRGEVPILFDVLLHISTLAVVVMVFRARIGAVLVSLGRWAGRRWTAEQDGENLRIVRLGVLATVVTGVLGVGISRLEPGGSPTLVGVLFLVTAGILIATRVAAGSRGYREMGAGRALLAGFAQGLGVFPGISRAGITISAGLLSGVARREAAEFSFLISIPAILGALVLTLRDFGELAATVPPVSLAAGVVSSFLVGLLSLKLLLRLVRGGRLYLFALYLVPLGILTIILT
jgi:undecaprenyl-diphosphatase